MNKKHIYELYYLRRPDKIDPIEPEFWQPFYAGRGKNKRKYEHRREALKLWNGDKNVRNTNPVRNNIIHKLWSQGLDYIEDTILVELTNEEANLYEMDAIAAYGRMDLKTGCLSNMSNGGDGCVGRIHTEETKQKMRDSAKGKPKTEEARRNMSKAQKGREGIPHTDEWKQMMSERMSGEGNPMYDKEFSDEHRRKISEAGAGKTLSEDHKNKIGNSNTGKIRTEEQRKAISENKKGKILNLSEERRQQLREQMSGDNNPMKLEANRLKLSKVNKGKEPWITGKFHSEETKQKMRKPHKKKIQVSYEEENS